MFKRLCETYSINYEEFGIEHSLMMVNLRRYMAANSYNRYLTFIIANEVSDETVAAILEIVMTLSVSPLKNSISEDMLTVYIVHRYLAIQEPYLTQSLKNLVKDMKAMTL